MWHHDAFPCSAGAGTQALEYARQALGHWSSSIAPPFSFLFIYGQRTCTKDWDCVARWLLQPDIFPFDDCSSFYGLTSLVHSPSPWGPSSFSSQASDLIQTAFIQMPINHLWVLLEWYLLEIFPVWFHTQLAKTYRHYSFYLRNLALCRTTDHSMLT